MAEWKVHRGFLDSGESGDTSAQPQATPADRAGPASAAPSDPRIDDDPLVELARIVSESAANLGRLGTQPGDEPTLILGRATPKPLPLRPESGVGSGGPGTAPGYINRATPTLTPNAAAPASGPSSAPPVEPPTRGANPLTFEDDLLAELRQSVDPRPVRPVAATPFATPAAPSAAPAAAAPVLEEGGRLAALRAVSRPSGDEPTARVAQVVQSAMRPEGRPPLDDDGGPTIALNLRGGARPGATVPPLSVNPLEDGFDDLFADRAPAMPSGPTTASMAPKLTAGQPARDPQGPRLGDNFPRPAMDGATTQQRQRPTQSGGRTRPVRPEPRRNGVGTGLFVAGSVLSVVVLGGLGYLGYRTYASNLSVTSTGVPVIKSVGKVKEEPPARPATASDTSAPRLSPDMVEDKTKLVTRSEEPVDKVAVGPRQITPGAPGTVVPQPTGGDQPRTVKTVVVRPDGTVVQQATPAPAPTPVRTQPVTPAGDNGQLVAVAPNPVAVPVAPPRAEAPRDLIGQQIAPAPAPTAAAPVKPVTPPPTTAPKLATPPAPAPVPAARPPLPGAPVGAPLALGPQAQPTAPAAVPGQVQPRLAAAPPPAPLAPAAAPRATAPVTGDYVVQLSSQRSEADAQRAYAQAQAKYPALAGHALDVQKADLGARGVFYRVRVAGGSQEQAQALCGQIKSAGGDCLVNKR